MSERDAPAPAARRKWLSKPQEVAVWLVGAGAVVSFVFWNNPPGQQEARPSGGPSTIEAAVINFIKGEAAPETDRVQPGAANTNTQANTGTGRVQPGGGSVARPAEPTAYLTSFAPAEPYPYAKPPAPPAPPPAPAGGVSGGASGGVGGRGETTVAFAGTALPGRRAGRAIDMTYVMRPGIYTCTLMMAVSSERPGPLFCQTDVPIFSQAGVSLMKKGTTITGRYESDVGQGQERINAMYASAITPDGIPVPLGATAGDSLGRTGLAGNVDTHWKERFGSAAILLLTQSSMNLAQEFLRSRLTGGGVGNTSINIQGSGIERAVGDALGAGRQVQNTVTLNQGAQVSFLLTEPIDFSDAISVEPR